LEGFIIRLYTLTQTLPCDFDVDIQDVEEDPRILLFAYHLLTNEPVNMGLFARNYLYDKGNETLVPICNHTGRSLSDP